MGNDEGIADLLTLVSLAGDMRHQAVVLDAVENELSVISIHQKVQPYVRDRMLAMVWMLREHAERLHELLDQLAVKHEIQVKRRGA